MPPSAPQWGQQPPPWNGPGLPPPGYAEHTAPLLPVPPPPPVPQHLVQRPMLAPPPWGGYPPPPQPARSHRAAWWWIGGGGFVALAGTAVAIIAAAGGFTTYLFDQAGLEDGVHRTLVDDYKLADVGTVTCPPDQEIVPGARFTCTASIAGEDRTITITVLNDAGQYRVDQPA